MADANFDAQMRKMQAGADKDASAAQKNLADAAATAQEAGTTGDAKNPATLMGQVDSLQEEVKRLTRENEQLKKPPSGTA